MKNLKILKILMISLGIGLCLSGCNKETSLITVKTVKNITFDIPESLIGKAKKDYKQETETTSLIEEKTIYSYKLSDNKNFYYVETSPDIKVSIKYLDSQSNYENVLKELAFEDLSNFQYIGSYYYEEGRVSSQVSFTSKGNEYYGTMAIIEHKDIQYIALFGKSKKDYEFTDLLISSFNIDEENKNPKIYDEANNTTLKVYDDKTKRLSVPTKDIWIGEYENTYAQTTINISFEEFQGYANLSDEELKSIANQSIDDKAILEESNIVEGKEKWIENIYTLSDKRTYLYYTNQKDGMITHIEVIIGNNDIKEYMVSIIEQSIKNSEINKAYAMKEAPTTEATTEATTEEVTTSATTEAPKQTTTPKKQTPSAPATEAPAPSSDDGVSQGEEIEIEWN